MSVVIGTARDDEREIVRLLDAGADDYLVKPFSMRELQARVAALFRRPRTSDLVSPSTAAATAQAAEAVALAVLDPATDPATVDRQDIGADRGSVGQRHDKLAKVLGPVSLPVCERRCR